MLSIKEGNIQMVQSELPNGGNILKTLANSEGENGLHDGKKYQIIYADP